MMLGHSDLRQRQFICTSRGATCKPRQTRSNRLQSRIRRILRFPGDCVSPAMTRPAVEVADLLHTQGDRFMDQSPWLSFQQLSVLRAITRCRTAALGGHSISARQCGHQAISYNSCRNRHCPKCQAQARQRWLPRARRNSSTFLTSTSSSPSLMDSSLVYRNARFVYLAFPRQRGHHARSGGQSATPGGADWFHQHPAHVGPKPALPSACALRGPGGWALARSRAVDSPEVRGFFLPVKVLSPSFARSLLTRCGARTTGSSTSPAAPPNSVTLQRGRLRRFTFQDRLGRLRQAGLRWRLSRAPLSRPLYPSRRHQQSPVTRL